MKVQLLDRKLTDDQMGEPESFPGLGVYLVQEEDEWWHLVVVHKYGCNRLILGSNNNIEHYKEVLFKDDPTPLPPAVVTPADDTPFKMGFSFEQVLELLRAARGTDDRRI